MTSNRFSSAYAVFSLDMRVLILHKAITRSKSPTAKRSPFITGVNVNIPAVHIHI